VYKLIFKTDKGTYTEEERYDIHKTAHGWYLCENQRGREKQRKTKRSSMESSEDALELIAPALSAGTEKNETHEANHSLSHHHLP